MRITHTLAFLFEDRIIPSMAKISIKEIGGNYKYYLNGNYYIGILFNISNDKYYVLSTNYIINVLDNYHLAEDCYSSYYPINVCNIIHDGIDYVGIIYNVNPSSEIKFYSFVILNEMKVLLNAPSLRKTLINICNFKMSMYFN